jgi:hypothetical protein
MLKMLLEDEKYKKFKKYKLFIRSFGMFAHLPPQ